MGSPHAPEKPTPAPAVRLSKPQSPRRRPHPGPGSARCLPVGKDVQQPEQFPVHAAGRGDDRRQEGVTHTFGRVTRRILIISCAWGTLMMIW